MKHLTSSLISLRPTADVGGHRYRLKMMLRARHEKQAIDGVVLKAAKPEDAAHPPKCIRNFSAIDRGISLTSAAFKPSRELRFEIGLRGTGLSFKEISISTAESRGDSVKCSSALEFNDRRKADRKPDRTGAYHGSQFL